jgi:WD40 repeat protein
MSPRHWCLPAVVLLLIASSPMLAGGGKKGTQYAVLVGVKEYKHEKLPPLKYSENDVVVLAKLLRAAGYNVTLLCDSMGEKDAQLVPNKVNIERVIKDVLRKCDHGDTVILAFAGHGLQFQTQKDAFFCPLDARPLMSATDSLVSLGKVYEALDGSFASVKVLLVDACRDDPDAGRGSRGVDADHAPRPPSGVAALFSCRAGERAYEDKKYEHGVFFYHLLKGLQGEAKNAKGNVTFAGLAEYVQEQVSADVPKLIGEGAKQSPNVKMDQSGPPLTLITNAVATTAVAAAPGTYDLTGGKRFCHFGPDNAFWVLIHVLDGKGMLVMDAKTGEKIAGPFTHKDVVFHAAFSPDGTRVVTASFDKTAVVWNAKTGQKIAGPLTHQDAVQHAAFSPDGTRVVTASLDKTAVVWDARTGQKIAGPLTHEGAVWHAAFSPDGTRVVTATRSGDKTAVVWDARTGQKIAGPLRHKLWVVHAAFSPDGTRVVTASTDKTAVVWDARIGEKIAGPLTHEGAVFYAAFSPDGTRVVTASFDKTAVVWNAKTGQKIAGPLTHEKWVLHAAFSPDGTRVVTASSDKTAVIWDARTGEKIAGPLIHQNMVRYAAYSPDGTRVVTAGTDETAVKYAENGFGKSTVWDAVSGKKLGEVSAPK